MGVSGDQVLGSAGDMLCIMAKVGCLPVLAAFGCRLVKLQAGMWLRHATTCAAYFNQVQTLSVWFEVLSALLMCFMLHFVASVSEPGTCATLEVLCLDWKVFKSF